MRGVTAAAPGKGQAEFFRLAEGSQPADAHLSPNQVSCGMCTANQGQHSQHQQRAATAPRCDGGGAARHARKDRFCASAARSVEHLALQVGRKGWGVRGKGVAKGDLVSIWDGPRGGGRRVSCCWDHQWTDWRGAAFRMLRKAVWPASMPDGGRRQPSLPLNWPANGWNFK
jgi:hypothetical protein